MHMKSNHPFHLVEESPWPITTTMSAFLLAVGLAKWFHDHNSILFILALISINLSVSQWWRDVTREATYQGHHTKKVLQGLRWGMVFFIVSEIFFFFSFFWAFFHSALNPTMEIGLSWPPTSVITLNPFQVPLLNTAILLASGVTVTWAHHALTEASMDNSYKALAITIFLGFYFTALQALEYHEASFTMADSLYGSIFFLATGFHGLHVYIGTQFLIAAFVRLMLGHFSTNHHFGLEASIWYWHFVDVVWLFLFVSIYWWGS